MKSPPDLVRLGEAFAVRGVRWVLIGGMAMVVHGASSVTADTDVLFATDSGNEESLCEALNDLHARPIRGQAVSLDRSMLAMRFLHLDSDAGPVDLIRSPQGIDSFDGLFERAISVALGSVVLRVACLDDLIAMKEASGRAKDQLHLIELKGLMKKSKRP